VNNMPAGAFAETERQFLGLLEAAAGSRCLDVDGYVLSGIDRPEVGEGYRPARHLADRVPDALVVTGTEPKRADLRAEPYWEELADLLRWADTTVPSMLLSCLAAHAAVLVLDGVERVPLRAKASGVYAQSVDRHHPLALDVEEAALPHSRYNDVPVEVMEAHGYDVLARSAEVGWSVATRDDGVCLVVLAQGHPEYSPDTLLREYRRDVRRFLEESTAAYPRVPEGYLDAAGEDLLEAFASQAAAVVAASGSHGAEALMEAFPFEAALRHVRAGWRPAASRLVANWLETVATRTHAGVLR
jgi:homoserine O-succinyltransferase